MTDWVIILNNKIIKQFPLNEGETVTIGRGSEADIVIDNTAISRLHIAIELINGLYLVSDLGSKNGTFVNGKKIQANESVSETDLIEFSKFRLAPASGIDEDLRLTDTVSADTMNLDEATVFVPSHAPANINNRISSGPGKTRLYVVSGNATPKELSIEGKNSIKIGKNLSCDIVIPGFLVAQAQCYIFKRENDFILVPQWSWVGTFINDIKISNERKLVQGDIIRINKTSIKYIK